MPIGFQSMKCKHCQLRECPSKTGGTCPGPTRIMVCAGCGARSGECEHTRNAPQAWECIRCHAIHAPHSMVCYCVGLLRFSTWWTPDAHEPGTAALPHAWGEWSTNVSP